MSPTIRGLLFAALLLALGYLFAWLARRYSRQDRTAELRCEICLGSCVSLMLVAFAVLADVTVTSI